MIVFAAFLLLASTTVAYATYPVIDSSAIAKLTEQIKQFKESLLNQIAQLNELKKQVEFLTDISKFANDITKAIGDIATIKLPRLNINKLSDQLKKDVKCLLPDGAQWGIQFEDLELNICGLSSKYRSKLFTNADEIKGLEVSEQNKRRLEVSARRAALYIDTVTRSLATADQYIQQAETRQKALEQLQSDADSAETMQDRLAVANQVAIAQIQATSSMNMLLAQQLKVQTVVAIKAGLGADDITLQDEGAE